jgi:hypothetical protein
MKIYGALDGSECPVLFTESRVFMPDLRKYDEFHLNVETYYALKGEENLERERKR